MNKSEVLARNPQINAHSLVVRPLTFREVHAMDTEEYDWHLANNKENVEAALHDSMRSKEEAAAKAEADLGERLARSELTEDEGQSQLAIWRKFGADHPQIAIGLTDAQAEENGRLIYNWIASHKLPISTSNMQRAVEALVLAGTPTFVISPRVIGIDRYDMTGEALKDAINDIRLLRPAKQKTEVTEADIAKMDLEQYDDYLARTGHALPRIDRDISREEAGVPFGGYGRGSAHLPKDYANRKKVEDTPSEKYLAKLRDPKFREIVDGEGENE